MKTIIKKLLKYKKFEPSETSFTEPVTCHCCKNKATGIFEKKRKNIFLLRPPHIFFLNLCDSCTDIFNNLNKYCRNLKLERINK